jgi:hypothetical protein
VPPSRTSVEGGAHHQQPGDPGQETADDIREVVVAEVDAAHADREREHDRTDQRHQADPTTDDGPHDQG